jgi:hypothetical protein
VDGSKVNSITSWLTFLDEFHPERVAEVDWYSLGSSKRNPSGVSSTVLNVGVGRGARNKGSECALNDIDLRVVDKQVDGPEHGNLPQLDDACVEGSQ